MVYGGAKRIGVSCGWCLGRGGRGELVLRVRMDAGQTDGWTGGGSSFLFFGRFRRVERDVGREREGMRYLSLFLSPFSFFVAEMVMDK